MRKIKVSVIIPAYNRANILPRAIKSVLGQKCDGIEAIVVDDNSSDATPEVVRNMQDPRIRFLKRTKNGGVAAARNDGMRISEGEYVAFLDSDDVWAPGKIDAQLKVFEENKSVGMIYTNANIITVSDCKAFIDKPELSRVVYGSADRVSGIFPGAVTVAPPSSWMLKKSVVDEIGFFDEAMKVWEDCDYFVKIAQNSDIYFLNMPLISINKGDCDQLSSKMSAWHEGKKIFLSRYFSLMDKDKRYLFQFYKGMGKDCLILQDRAGAIKWFAEALRIKPFDLNLYWKIIKARLYQNQTSKTFK
jgi:glycosyltransferase involved in cell wall biosynthesis